MAPRKRMPLLYYSILRQNCLIPQSTYQSYAQCANFHIGLFRRIQKKKQIKNSKKN